MKTKAKTTILLFILMAVMFLALIVNVAYGLRDYGIKSVNNKAIAVAEVVKHGLTAHMINGAMDNREIYLDEIGDVHGISQIWLARADTVIDQYGKGFNNEVARDEIDLDVLKNGVEKVKIDDNLFEESSYRITIPYKATDDPALNCTVCHISKVGDTLGAISIVINMDDLKAYGLESILSIAAIGFFLIIAVLAFVNYVISPYLNIFDSIKSVMQSANKGDYSQRLEKTHGESEEVRVWINTLLEKLQNALLDIEKNFSVFLSHGKKANSDPLLEVKETVNRLSDIYKFRKTIEHDERLEDVYERLAFILQKRFNIQNFNFLEADTTNKLIELAYEDKKIMCNAVENGCRADMTNVTVNSCQFENLCNRRFADACKNYICIPYSISNDLDFIINFNFKDEAEHDRVRNLLPMIKDYVDTAKPEIVSKKLMQILEKSARTDPLTGLYNRKFLEESVENIVSQAKRAGITYGILMCDIDYFKMINDTYGHDVGDRAIKVIADTLIDNTRSSDVVIRYGGEEFIVLLYNCGKDHILEVAEKIRVEFAKKKIKAENTTFTKTISIGAAMFPDPEDSDPSFWKTIKYADIALYHAKETGRDRVVLFNKSLLKEEDISDKEY